MIGQCVDCRFWVPRNSDGGTCQRNAPVAADQITIELRNLLMHLASTFYQDREPTITPADLYEVAPNDSVDDSQQRVSWPVTDPEDSCGQFEQGVGLNYVADIYGDNTRNPKSDTE